VTDTLPSCLSQVDDVCAALARWIPLGSDVAIVDVPVHRNLGDLFILAATRRLLAEMQCQVVYSVGARDYRVASARRAIAPGVIIVGLGGGNFGDLYPKYQRLREQVIRDFAGHRIVVLPQTLHFRNVETLGQCVERLGRHGDLCIAARDMASYEMARQITPHVALMADIVDVVGPGLVANRGDRRPAAARRFLAPDGTLVLHRRDAERGAGLTVGYDWPDLFPGYAARLAVAAALMPLVPAGLSARLHERWASMAMVHLLDTVGIMRHASRVVTDRLHAAILARLAGRPVALLDNSNGKIAAYYEAWWRADPAVTLLSADTAGRVAQP
jgi:pyruvyl transferase EpsO